MSAFGKDILRTIRGSLKRFLSLVAICALGATMLTGLDMACLDLRAAANSLYERQHLFDISVQSTFGLTQDDIDELAEIDGVSAAEGGYEEDTYTRVDGLRASVTVKALLDSGMNEPYVVDGRLPEAANEIAVTENYLTDTGKSIGDTVTFEDAEQDDPTGLGDLSVGEDSGDAENSDADDAAESDTDDAADSDLADSTDSAADDATSSDDDSARAESTTTSGPIPGGTYTIVGTVVDPTSITQPDGPVAFRASTSSEYVFFVSRDAVTDTDTYTVAYLSVSGTDGLSTYSDEYNDRVDEVKARVEDLAPQRERARAQEIKDEANATIDEEEAEALAQLAEAKQELDDAQATLDQSLAEALEGQRELNTQRAEALSELASAQATIDESRVQAESGMSQAQAGLVTIASARAALNDQLEQIDQLEEGKAQVDAAVQVAEAAVIYLQSQGDELIDGLEQLGTYTGTDAASVRDAWEALCGYTGTAEPDELEQAFIDAVAQYRTDVEAGLQNLRQQASVGLAALAQQFAEQIDERAQVAEQLDEIDERIAEIDERAGQITTRLDEIKAELAALTEDDPTYEELTAERAELLGKQTALASERDKLEEEQTDLEAERTSLNEQLADYDSLLAQIDQIDEALEQLAALTADGTDQVEQLAQGMGQATSGLAQARAAATEVDAIIDELPGGIDGARRSIRVALAQLDAQEIVARSGLTEAQSGLAALDEGQQALNEQRASALAQLAEAQQEIDDALEQIADGQIELDEGRDTYETERSDALEQIADVRAQVEDVDDATWYVQDRSGLSSYSSVDSDASSIEAIAKIIPVIFFVVAVLVSLTTATRMVEEERELIGLYKALGYSNARILSKYLIYTLIAAVIGGFIGDIAGFVLIPLVLLHIFKAMYLLPLFSLQFNLFYAVLGILAFVVGITGSTLITCRIGLRETPAALMRPRAPRAGSRIFLERIKPLWRRMNFLNKVTARNLFRYKKRLAMTIFGIMGCTALLICGFSIKNTVESLAPRQYEDIYRYDLMAATTADDYAACLNVLESSDEVTDIASIGVDTITVEFDDDEESMQLYVIPTGLSIDSYVSLETLDGASIDLDEAGIVLTNNAATLLGVERGDSCSITTSALDTADVTITEITRNYLGNAVYMTQDVYEELFGELELNGFYAHLSGTSDEQVAFGEVLEADDDFLSITSVAKMHEQFEQSFTLINVVVYVVIVLAAGLAFVVLFTLSTVNIGEREREIATIKVLGFRVGEVRTYINKETFLLTFIGIVVGLPAGWALSESFTYIMKMPSIFFDVVVDPWCYALAAAFSAVFAIAVSFITNRILDRIDMVEALKSPE